jgi:hypothetical protein
MLTRKWSILVMVTFCLAIVPTAWAKGGVDLLYATSDTGQFGLLNPQTGEFQLIFQTSEPSDLLSGLASGPKDTTYGLDADNNLVIVDPQTHQISVVGNTGLPVQKGGNVTLITSLGSERLFAVDPFNDLYTIDSITAEVQLIGSTGIPPALQPECVIANSLTGAEGGLYLTWEVRDNKGMSCKSITPSFLYRIDQDTGTATRVGETFANAPIVGAGFIDNTLYGFTLGDPVGKTNQILAIDLQSGEANVVTEQDLSLTAVFGAIPAASGH